MDRLAELLGEGFALAPAEAGAADAVFRLSARGGGNTELQVDVRSSLSPADADRMLRPRAELLRRLRGRAALLVVAPWLGPRTRTVLDGLQVNYLDLTGNVRLDVERPRVLIHLLGADRDPWPGAGTGGTRSLAGPRSGRLVRLLVDRPPPYRVTELAGRTGLSIGYVSRLIDLIEDLGLLERDGKVITSVDWVGLLRERAGRTDLLRAGHPIPAVAPRGVQDVLARLRSTGGGPHDSVTVTGAVAAAAYAPLTVGGQLMLYVPADGWEQVADAGGLLPTEDGANVLLLVPSDPGVQDGRRRVDGMWHVALSQLALDCLSGPDRLPAAGESVLRQMIDTEREWRRAD